ncbi:unnamed protein product [Musa hybrid cultivar]
MAMADLLVASRRSPAIKGSSEPATSLQIVAMCYCSHCNLRSSPRTFPKAAKEAVEEFVEVIAVGGE